MIARFERLIAERPGLRRALLGATAVALACTFVLAAGAGAPDRLAGIPQDDKRIGTVGAPVVITEYVDLLCEACSRHNAAVGERLLEEARAGRVVVDRMPLAHVADESRGLAYAALAAARQDRLWHFTERWFELVHDGDARADAPTMMRIARDAGLDLERFARDFADTGARENDLRATTAVARNDGVTATPSLVITGAGGVRLLSGIASPEVVSAAIGAVERE